MSAPPKTKLDVTPEEAERIRSAVRSADISGLGFDCVAADLSHARALTDLLLDPSISGAIYDLPSPLTVDSVAAWIGEAQARRARGEALLVVRADPAGVIYSYSYFTVWPELAAAEIAGAFRADRQGEGRGKSGAARSFGWMFDALKVRLICVTAAIDNVRSAKVIEAAGFTPMGERDARRADGSLRRSLYWEMTRESWSKQAQPTGSAVK